MRTRLCNVVDVIIETLSAIEISQYAPRDVPKSCSFYSVNCRLCLSSIDFIPAKEAKPAKVKKHIFKIKIKHATFFNIKTLHKNNMNARVTIILF